MLTKQNNNVALEVKEKREKKIDFLHKNICTREPR
jgi:hypothetical protein